MTLVQKLENNLLLCAFGAVKEGVYVDVHAGLREEDPLFAELRRRGWRGIEADSLEALRERWAGLSPEEVPAIHLLRVRGVDAAIGVLEAILPHRPWVAWTETADNPDDLWRERRYTCFLAEQGLRCYVADERRSVGCEEREFSFSIRQEELIRRLSELRDVLAEENARLTLQLAGVRLELKARRHRRVVRHFCRVVAGRVGSWLWNKPGVRKTCHFLAPSGLWLSRVVRTAWWNVKAKASSQP